MELKGNTPITDVEDPRMPFDPLLDDVQDLVNEIRRLGEVVRKLEFQFRYCPGEAMEK